MAIHLGRERAGWRGLVVAGACFILPAFAIVLACAWAYVRWGSLPAAQGLLYGVKPVMIAVVLQALSGLGRTATRTMAIAAVGALSLAAAALGVHELVVLLVAGLALGAQAWRRQGRRGVVATLAASLGTLAPRTRLGCDSRQHSGRSYRGGPSGRHCGHRGRHRGRRERRSGGRRRALRPRAALLLLPEGRLDPLRQRLRSPGVPSRRPRPALGLDDRGPVARRGGGRPGHTGPVFTTATFVGYVLGGVPGAVLATVGIFLPSFVFVALSGPLVPRLRRSAIASGFLDGVNVASIALMAVVTVQLGRAAIVDGPTLALAVAAAVLLIRFRVGSAWLVRGGCARGLAFSFLR